MPARLIDDRPDFDFAQARLDNPFGLVLPKDLFGALLFQVTGQQLSIPATRRNLARVEALFGGHLPSPTELMGVHPARLRKAGLSWRSLDHRGAEHEDVADSERSARCATSPGASRTGASSRTC